MLSELGIPGALLMLTFIGGGVVAILRARRLGPEEATLAAGVLAIGAYWLAHASVDWFWSYAAITLPVPFVIGAAAAPALRREGARERTPIRTGRSNRPGRGRGLALTMLPFFFSARDTNHAIRTWHADLAGAYSDLDNAADLNPWSSRALEAKAGIAIANGDSQLALSAIDEGINRTPNDWLLYYLRAQAQGRADLAGAAQSPASQGAQPARPRNRRPCPQAGGIRLLVQPRHADQDYGLLRIHRRESALKMHRELRSQPRPRWGEGLLRGADREALEPDAPTADKDEIMRKFTLKRLGGLALLAVIAAVAIAPATALAQDALSNPSASQYEPKSQVQGTNTTGSAANSTKHLGTEWQRRFPAVHGYGRDGPGDRGCCADRYRRRAAQAVRTQGPQGVTRGKLVTAASDSVREVSARRNFPYLSGLSAQRQVEFLTLRVAPALTGGLIAYQHLSSEWVAVLVSVCMFAAVMLLRRPRYPLHLIPLASAIIYLRRLRSARWRPS